MIWENGIETCIISYMKWVARPGLGRIGNVKVLKRMELRRTITFIFLLFFLYLFYFLTLQYCIGFAIYNMNLPQVYMCSPSWTLLPPCTIPLGHPSAPAPSFQYRASNLDWWPISYMILYMFQCHSPNSSHPLPLPQSPKDCSIHQCLFCCLVYRVIVTIFLNSIYMH